MGIWAKVNDVVLNNNRKRGIGGSKVEKSK